MRKEWCDDHKVFHVVYEPGDPDFNESAFRVSAIVVGLSSLFFAELKKSGLSEDRLKALLGPFHAAFLDPCSTDLGCILMNPNLLSDLVAQEFHLGFVIGRGVLPDAEQLVRDRLEFIKTLPKITKAEAFDILATEHRPKPEVNLPSRPSPKERKMQPPTTPMPKYIVDAFKDEKEDK